VTAAMSVTSATMMALVATATVRATDNNQF
jgi:hypothetical protein